MFMVKVSPNPGARVESYAKILRGGVYEGHRFMCRLFNGNEFVYCQPHADRAEFLAYQPELSVNTPGGFQVQAKEVPEFRTGQELAFQLSANATRALAASETNARGKRVGIITKAAMQSGLPRGEVAGLAAGAWLREQSYDAGFSVTSVRLNADRRIEFSRRCETVMLDVVDLAGSLIVTDPALFKAKLMAGFGRGKRFGFGMMMLGKKAG